MIILNKPEQLIQVQCYRCKSIMDVHPMTNMNAPWITDCNKHKKVSDKYKQDNCRHGIYENSCEHYTNGECEIFVDFCNMCNTRILRDDWKE
jgi:hypothetical protein